MAAMDDGSCGREGSKMGILGLDYESTTAQPGKHSWTLGMLFCCNPYRNALEMLFLQKP